MKDGQTLKPADYAMLERSTITRQMAHAPFVDLRRVGNHEGAAIVGQRVENGRRFDAIEIPYFSLEGLHRASRIRRDHPDLELQPDGSHKEKGKYLAAPGQSNCFYYPAICHIDDYCEWVKNPAIPVVFVEGEKKALALMRIALSLVIDGRPPFVVIGLSGVWNWKGTIGKTTDASGERVDEKGIIADFYTVPFNGRAVWIFFDANVSDPHKPEIRAARRQLAERLRDEFEAKVFFVDMPADSEADGLNGLDDLAFARGDAAVIACIEARRPAFKPTAAPKETAQDKQDRAKKRAFLQAKVSQAIAKPDAEDLAARTLGKKTLHKLAFLWAQAGNLDSKARDLLFCLHALADGESEADFFYSDLHDLLFRRVGTESDSTINQRVRRYFENLFDGEAACEIQFVELTPGREEDGERIPSHIKLLSYDYIEDIEAIAAIDPHRSRGIKAAYERATATWTEARTGSNYRRPQPKRKNLIDQIEDGWKRAGGNVRTTVKRMQDGDLCGYQDWAIALDLAKMLRDSVPGDLWESAEFQETLRDQLFTGEPSKLKPNHDSLDRFQFSPPDSPTPPLTDEVSDGSRKSANAEILDTSKNLQTSETEKDADTGFQKICKNEQAEDLSTGDLSDTIFESVTEGGRRL